MDEIAIAGKTGIEQGLQLCKVCGTHSRQADHPHTCPNCANTIAQREKHSIQKTSAFLVTACLFFIPANLYPITYLLKNNTLHPSTIFAGISALKDSGMIAIATIVFIASIVVPVLKIVILAVIVISVQFNLTLSAKMQLWAFNIVELIGKWSILDLFVISIMVAVFDKGHLLSIYPGIAATSFTVVVLTTLYAANSFDTRLIWDAQR